MKFVVDHDLHIHTYLSPCSSIPEQNPETILQYAKENNLKRVCVTDHFWDAAVPTDGVGFEKLNLPYVKQVLPLPQDENVSFLFGCEAEVDKNFNVGVSAETAKLMDFVIVSFTHMHLYLMTTGYENPTTLQRMALYVHRFEKLLQSPTLPDGRTGIAHLTTALIADGRYDEGAEIISNIPDSVWRSLFTEAARRRFGVELNFDAKKLAEMGMLETHLRPFKIARECGCKFYVGSDAHSPGALKGAMERSEDMVDVMDLQEEEKYIPEPRPVL